MTMPIATEPRRVVRAYTDCRFGQMHYRTAAPAVPSDRPALVLLHQNPSSSAEYGALIAEMARDRVVVAFDTSGNGMSDAPPAPQPMQGYAEAFGDAMTALGLGAERPVDVFGYHTGTYLATELALAMPDRVGRLVLSGVPMRSDEERAAALAKAQAVTLPDEQGGDLLVWLHWLWTYVVVERLPGVPLERAVWTFADKAAAMHRRAWAYHGVWSYPAAERLPLVRQPVLILQPHEPLLEPTRRAAALFPDATFTELPDLSRDVFEVGIETLSHHLRSFLR